MAFPRPKSERLSSARVDYAAHLSASLLLSFAVALSSAVLVTGVARAQTPSQSQSPSSGTGNLAPVVITATRIESRADTSIADVSVIPRTELERSAGRSLAQVLVQQPGIQASSNGGLGQFSALFIRGMESRHTLLLIDGMRLGSATAGTPSLDNLPIEGFERIEVVRGPLSAIYGADPAGGVIQLLSRRADQGLQGNAAITVGSRRFGQMGAGASWAGGMFDGGVQVSRTHVQGFSATNPNAAFGAYDPDRDGFGQTTGIARFGMQIARDWRLEWSGMQARAQVDYDDGPGSNARARLEHDLQALRLKGDVGTLGRSNFSVGQSNDRYLTLRSAYGADSSPTRTRQLQWGWEQQIDTRMGTAIALIERLEQKVAQPVEYGSFALDRRTIDSLGLGFDGQIQDHLWQAALRHDRNSQFGSQSTGALGFSAALTSQWRAGASWGSSFVMPSFNLLYGPAPYSNPSLRPEQGRHAEVHLAWSPAPQQKLRLAWVDNRMRDLISSGVNPVNIAQSRIDGIVMSWSGQYGALRTGMSWDHLDARNTTPGDPDEGRQLRRRARDVVRISTDAPMGSWQVGATLAAWSARFDDAANTQPLSGFGTIDLRAETAIAPQWRMGLRLDNLMDKVYETAQGYNQPRRGAYLTLRWAGR